MGQRILRPLGYGELLDETFDLYKRNFLLFAGISAVVNLPFYVLTSASDSRDASTIAFLLIGPVTTVVTAATTWAVSRTYLGKNASILAAYKSVLLRLLPLTATMIVGSLAAAGGFVLLLVPGIMVTIALFLMSPVVMLEGKGSVAAVRRCWQLSRGNFLRLLVLGVLTTVISIIASTVLTLPADLLMGVGLLGQNMPQGGAAGAVYGLVTGVAEALSGPIQAIAFVLLYYDVRVRKEAFDLELLAAGLGESSEPKEAQPV